MVPVVGSDDTYFGEMRARIFDDVRLPDWSPKSFSCTLLF